MKQLETALGQTYQPPLPPPIQRTLSTSLMQGVAPGINGDTALGIASVGGCETIITANYPFGLIRDLQAKVDVLTERSKNTGVIFQQVAFSYEAEFNFWYAPMNSSGSGLAAFVDLVLIWTFASGNQVDLPNGSMRFIVPRLLVSRGATRTWSTPTPCLGAILPVLLARTKLLF